MKITIIFLSILCSALFFPRVSYATDVDILVTFSADTGLNTAQKTALYGRYTAALTAVFNVQLDGNNTVSVHYLPASLSYSNSTNKATIDALEWMKSENAELTSPLRLARDIQKADLVIMVVPGVSDNVCGHAGVENNVIRKTVPRLVSTVERNAYAFAVVVNEANDPDCVEANIVPHEIGHLLYAEHQTDQNGDTSSPSAKNHAMQAGSLKSLMWSAPDDNYLSGSLPSITSSSADNVDFISDASFEVVSKYREAPGQSAMLIIPMGCWAGKIPQFDVSWAPGSTGGVPTSYEIQRMSLSTGNWAPWYDGDPNCIITNGSMGGTDFRIQTSNEVGVSEWLEYTLIGDCEEENPW